MKHYQTVGLLALLAAIVTTGCIKPPKVPDIEEIGPNETAWAIPLDGASQNGQVQFNSVSYLNAKKVQAKRITIDKVEKSIGRFSWQIEWIPAVRVVKVDRSLVTREWTDSPTSGTTNKKEGIGVVTKDSVQLRVGLTITANIEEEDASTYLYYHGAKKLADVIDQNIRSFAVAELTRQYSELSLMDAQTQGTQIYTQLMKDAREAFKLKGITVQYLGNSEGLTYADQKVQESINKRYMVEQDTKTAEMEQNAQKIRNATTILTAEATAQAAEKLFAAQQASEFQNELQIKMLEARARFQMASNWDGKLPLNILPANSPLLMSIGAR